MIQQKSFIHWVVSKDYEDVVHMVSKSMALSITDEIVPNYWNDSQADIWWHMSYKYKYKMQMQLNDLI
jgi:hypothetical protein